MRNTLLYIVILISFPLNGQTYFQDDTIKIQEVLISLKKIDMPLPGFKTATMDSLALRNYSHRNLADFLSEYSNIFIKSYGMGGTATPSFRGTGASHTQIAWNNIIINHPMLGQSDLSLIPAGLIDDIHVYYGGASMAVNSGGIGGLINLESKPDWKKETVTSINPGLGSYGQYSGLVKVKSGTANFQTVTKAFIQSSENNFRYLNTEISSEPVWETRKNSQVRQQGILQELYYKKAKNIASARFWYQSAKRNLPSSVLSQQVNTGEKQFDESFRTMLNYNLSGRNSDYFFTGAFLLSRLNYSNRLASINSLNLSESLIFKVGTERVIGDNIKLKFILDEDFSVIKSNNYGQNETRNTASLTASAEGNISERFGGMILIREIYNNTTFLIPDISVGFQFKLNDDQEYYLKTNVSRNSRVPTMNEMFWLPGGNPELKNEYAYIYELSYEMKQQINSAINIKYDLSLFRNIIKDMIQWHPGENSYWTADNIQNVNTMGLETSLSAHYKSNAVMSVFKVSYSYTNATTLGSYSNTDIPEAKQLIYVPENQINTSFFMNYRMLYSSWVANFTGRRYVTADNSRFLPSYFLNNVSTGIKINFNSNSLDIGLNIDNLFNINYQTIAYYPLPGRSYSLKILIQLFK